VRSLIVALASLTILLAGPGLDRASASAAEDGRGERASAGASIVGGTPTSIASYPWLAYIAYRGAVEEFSCGGTVVAPRLILTAAHCVLSETGKVLLASKFGVFTGIGDLREASRERVSHVSQVLVFPGYDPSRLLNDAALLVLAGPVPAPALPLATPSEAAVSAPGVPIQVAGWGLTDVSPPQLPAVLQEAQTVVQSPASCRDRLRRMLSTYSPAGQICVRSGPGPGAGLCNGDSGGPGIARRPDGTPVQIGIVSLKTSLDCDPRSPQVLARVDVVSSWVDAWRAAIESGTPAPTVVVPKVELPRVTRRDAEFLAWLALEADFGNRFTKAKFQEIGCVPINREKVKCRVEWLRGINYYRGGISIYAALPREGSIYNYRYRIRRFNAKCWLEYLHPIQACNPTIYRK
jgi:secreted trypsin-like serine protease